MDARLILTALRLVRDDFQTLNLMGLLNSLASAASTAASNPADVASQNAFTRSAEEARSACRSASANKAPLSLRKAVERIGLSQMIGEVIEARLHGILTRTPFLAMQASQTISSLQQQLENDLNAKVLPAIALLEGMGVTPLQGEASFAEVGILLPTSVVNHDLIAINSHLKQWERVVRHFSELATAKSPAEIRVAAVSSGSFEIYLSLDLDGAKAIGTVVASLVGAFIAVSQVRKVREEMEKNNYPKKMITDATEHEQGLLKNAVQEATDAALKACSQSLEPTRINELKTAIKLDVHFIAKSINEGVDVEVSPPLLPEGQEATANGPVIAKLRDLGQQINKLTRNLPDRKVPIGELAEAIEQGESPESHAQRPSKRK